MRIVVLSGSTGGLGTEILKICNMQGIRTIALYRNYNKVQELFKSEKNCRNISFAKSDFSDSKTVFDELEDELIKLCPSEITFIHTAYSIEPIKKVGDFSDGELLNNVLQNIIGPIILFNRLVNFSNCNNIKLNILNIDSGAAYRPLNGWSMYSSGKAYLNMFFKSIASENKRINVVSYEPGVIDTPMQKIIRMTEKRVFEDVDKFIDYYKKGTLASPLTIAEDIFRRYIIDWTGTNFNEGINN